MKLVTFIETILLLLLFFIILLKLIVHRIHQNKKYRFFQTFYFDDFQIINSKSQKAKKYKMLQNNLSFLALFLCVMLVITFIMI